MSMVQVVIKCVGQDPLWSGVLEVDVAAALIKDFEVAQERQRGLVLESAGSTVILGRDMLGACFLSAAQLPEPQMAQEPQEDPRVKELEGKLAEAAEEMARLVEHYENELQARQT